MRGLRGKVIIVAGAGSGIGAATARRLAEEGSSVVVGDLNGPNAEKVAAGIAEQGGTALAVTFDIADEASVADLIATTVSTFGGLDGAHVNAADLSPNTVGREALADAVTVPLDVFDRTIEVGLRGHLVMTRHVVPQLLARGGGALVYTSSAAAFAGEPTRPSYAMAKSGLLALSRHVASRWGKEGIRSNVLAPGLVMTDTIKANVPEDVKRYALEVGRSPRHGEPGDIAAAAAFLLSDDAGWINGQVLSVDGGVSMR
jgi:NAD(P)-dependent dehydrogenase (short-subunit alcohol dehydrogenase family)